MTTTTHIGIMPLTTTQGYGQLYSRRPVYIDDPTNIKPIEGIKWLLNINHSTLKPFEFETDMVWYKEQLLKIPLKALNPKVISIENEELHDPTKNIEDYLNQLKTAIETLPDYRITNGGFTLPLYDWYWQQTHDAEFFQNCIPDSSKQPLINGSINQRIQSVQIELDALKSLPIAFWNHHFYLWNVGAIAPMVRMIKYISDYIGKPAISNECGVYKPELLTDVISIARQCEMKFCILYSGLGKGGEMPPIALPISKEQFQQAII